MATTYKVLGQSAPSAATPTVLYTVPALTSTVVSTITIANSSSFNDAVRIAIRVGGAALTASQYIMYDLGIASNAHQSFSLGITLAATDIISVYSLNGTTSFNSFGSEIS